MRDYDRLWERFLRWGPSERVNDGDILGDVTDSLHRRRHRARSKGGEIPFEFEWELDQSTFRPADMLLCNVLQVVSASSDGTVKAWNPHATVPTNPSTIGSHNDYVRCLTHWYALAINKYSYIFNIFTVVNRIGMLLSLLTAQSIVGFESYTTDPLVTLNPPRQLPNRRYMLSRNRSVWSNDPDLQNVSSVYGNLVPAK